MYLGLLKCIYVHIFCMYECMCKSVYMYVFMYVCRHVACMCIKVCMNL